MSPPLDIRNNCSAHTGCPVPPGRVASYSQLSEHSSSQGTTPKSLKSVFRDSYSHLHDASITYGGQAKLPRLPIPTLDETLVRFPKAVEALQDEEQRQETKRIVEEFRANEGPVLQKLLIEYDTEGFEQGTRGSYIESFWNESYLSPDDSVVLNLNPFFVLEGGPDPKTATNQLARAASLCFASIKLASLLRQEKLKPDTFKGKPLCMDQYRVLFGSSRQPRAGQEDDEVHVFPESNHIVVLCKNQFYYFPVMWPNSCDLTVDERDFRDILEAIQAHAEMLHPDFVSETGLGGLTALPRSKWAAARQQLCELEINEISLNVIDSALFVLVLDDYIPDDLHHCAANMLHGTSIPVDKGAFFQQQGTCLNRWYDKLQLIVCKNGCAGVNFEHSAIDGHTALRFVSDVFADTVLSFAETITHLIHGKGCMPHFIEAAVKRAAEVRDADGRTILDIQPRKLVFELSDKLKKTIYYAETALCDQMVANDTQVLEFTDYGKLLIVGNNLSPDAVVQMSILLAYYRLYGTVVCQYEPAQTKSFYHGRTEAIRTTTPLAKKLCEVWCSKDSTPEMKLNALRAATENHSRLSQDAASGKGVDRHLYALKCIASLNGLPMPAFFESEAWKTLGHTVLSTSNCGNSALRFFGFGPVVPDGFGVGYIIKDHGLSFSVASKHRQTFRYVRTLQTILREIKTLLKPLSNVLVMDRYNESPVVPDKVADSYYKNYGETRQPVPMPPLVLVEPKARNRQKSRSGQVFSNVKEQTEGFDLSNAPHVVVDLEIAKSWGEKMCAH